MKFMLTLTAGMCVPVVVFLSSVVLHSVSAGGLYCAETARARAAALGLDYPGVHGAPDLSGPAHHGMHTGTMQLRDQPDVASHRKNQPGVRSLDDRIHKQAHPVGPDSAFQLSHETYSPVQSDYTTIQVLGPPRGQSVINRKSNFEKVKHIAPLTLAEAPGQSDLVNWDPQGRNKPLSFVYNEHDLVVDKSVLNRRGVSLSGLSLPQSWGHGPYQRGLTGLGREVPVLGSSGFANKIHIKAMTGRGPAAGRLRRFRFPGHLAQPLHRRLSDREFVRGNPVLRHMTKPKSGPVRISQRAKGV